MESVLAAVQAFFGERSPEWRLGCEMEVSGYVVTADHPATAGLVIETQVADPEVAIERCLAVLAASREVVVADAAPRLVHRDLVMGLRALVTAFEWPAVQVRGVAFLLCEHGVISDEEAAWLSGFVASDAPMEAVWSNGGGGPAGQQPG